jgi:iron-sulfur cluster assembly protein
MVNRRPLFVVKVSNEVRTSVVPCSSSTKHLATAAVFVSLSPYFSNDEHTMATAVSTKLAPITLTSRALVEVRNILTEKNVPAEYGLRVGVQGGGCSGLSYLLGFDKAKDQDETYDLDGVKLIMDKKHAMYVMGMEVDFQDGLSARGFVFNNPQAKSTCGCGSSFSA